MKPIIGIIEWPYVDQDGDKIYEVLNPIIEWVIRSGGMPIGIFPTQIVEFYDTRLKDIKPMNLLEKKDLIETLKLCSAIIKPGALKIYEHERYIYNYVVEKNIPYLGICAGMQIMASYKKQYIENERNIDNLHYSKEIYAHKIEILDDTLLKYILGKTEIEVNSRHNNHIKDNGIQKISAISKDGIIEAIENPNTDFNIGLQWHPELLPKEDENSKKIFESLIERAEHYQKIKRK